MPIKAGDTASVKIATMAIGDPKNPCFLVCPGSGSSKFHTLWYSRELAELGFYVLSFDPRDIGESQKFEEGGPADPMVEFAKFDPTDMTKPASEPINFPCYSVEDMIADMAKVLDDHGVKQCFVMGHSGGGGFAQYFTALHPDRVLGSVFCSCSFRPHDQAAAAESAAGKKMAEHMAKFPPTWTCKDDCPREAYVEAIANGQLAGCLLNGGGFGKVADIYKEIAGLDYDKDCVDWTYMNAARHTLAFVEFFQTGGLERIEEFARSNTKPVMVIHGQEDGVILFEEGQKLAETWNTIQFYPHQYGHNFGPPASQSQILGEVEEFAKKYYNSLGKK